MSTSQSSSSTSFDSILSNFGGSEDQMAEELLYKKVSATKVGWLDGVRKQMDALEPIAHRIEQLLQLWPLLVDDVLKRTASDVVQKYRDEKKELGMIAGKIPIRSQKVAQHHTELEMRRGELARGISEARIKNKAVEDERQRVKRAAQEESERLGKHYTEDAKAHRDVLSNAVSRVEFQVGFGQFVKENKDGDNKLFATIDKCKSPLFIHCDSDLGGKRVRGTFGSIYHASTLDGDTYAVKLPVSGRLYDNELEREGAIWDELQQPERHPNILEFHGACSVGMFKGLLSRWVTEGRSWRDSLSDFSEEQNIQLIERISSAIVHMHAKAIIHGDIKLDNVIISPTPLQPLLCDFGLSVRRLLDSTRDSVKGCGSGPHVSPQVYEGLQKTAGSDTWAFGILILHALSRTVPLSDCLANVPLELVPAFYYSLFTEKNLRPSMPANLSHAGVQTWSVGLACLHNAVDARPTMEDVHHAMQDILAGRDLELTARLERWKTDAEAAVRGEVSPEEELRG